jgi:hypothetical protein
LSLHEIIRLFVLIFDFLNHSLQNMDVKKM